MTLVSDITERTEVKCSSGDSHLKKARRCSEVQCSAVQCSAKKVCTRAHRRPANSGSKIFRRLFQQDTASTVSSVLYESHPQTTPGSRMVTLQTHHHVCLHRRGGSTAQPIEGHRFRHIRHIRHIRHQCRSNAVTPASFRYLAASTQPVYVLGNFAIPVIARPVDRGRRAQGTSCRRDRGTSRLLRPRSKQSACKKSLWAFTFPAADMPSFLLFERVAQCLATSFFSIHRLLDYCTHTEKLVRNTGIHLAVDLHAGLL